MIRLATSKTWILDRDPEKSEPRKNLNPEEPRP